MNYKGNMKSLVRLCMASLIWLMSCIGTQSQYNNLIDSAERAISLNPDSALSMLDVIEPTDLTVDSIRAKYHYVMARARDRQGHLRLSDSLISYSAEFYRNRDLKRSIESSTLLAWYRYWTGDSKEAVRMLDSLSSLDAAPDSLLLFPLRKRAYLDWKTTEVSANGTSIRRLMAIDRDSAWQRLYKEWLYIDYLHRGPVDSALIILNEFIGKAISEGSSSDLFSYEYEKIGVLEETGRYAESLELVDKFLTKAPDTSIKHYLHMWRSLLLFNMGDRATAVSELAKADSCASGISEAERGYYNSLAYALNTVFDYAKTGKLKLLNLAFISNSQKDRLFRTQYIQHDAEQSALETENKRLLLKARNERQTAITIIIILAALLITGGMLWYAYNRKRKELEAIEQTETLQRLVDELKATETDSAQSETLRRAMLRQLGIIKMVAETPTEQNREMLRKIYDTPDKTGSALVDWGNVYEIIDNLYSRFYSRLHERYGHLLTDREEQIIVLMVAGFSNKEISVITAQTTATVYVRKSAIRKKLGVTEKEDIVVFLRREGLA